MARNVPALTSEPFRLTPSGTVRKANEIAFRYAQEPSIRALAASITKRCKSVIKEGPTAIAEWIRSNIVYTQEHGEVLQGPFHTLPTGLRVGDFEFGGLGTGDCDDLSILFACLCRSINLPAYVVGLRDRGASSFFHAVGMCGGKLFELSNDDRYGAGPRRATNMRGLPRGTSGYYYDPQDRRSYTMGAGGAAKGKSGGSGIASPEAGLDWISAVDDGLAANGIDLSTVFGEKRLGRVVSGALSAGTSGLAASSSAMALAANAGAASAAVPVIGWVVAGAVASAVAAVQIAQHMKMRGRAFDYANEYRAFRDEFAKMLDPRDPAAEQMVRLRLDEIVPHVAGTYGTKGRGSRIVRIADWPSKRPPKGATWSTGTRKLRNGVDEVFRKGKNAEERSRNVILAHRNAMKALAVGASQLNIENRRRLMALLVDHVLGSGGRNGLPLWSQPMTQRAVLAPPVMTVLRPTATARQYEVGRVKETYRGVWKPSSTLMVLTLAALGAVALAR